MKITCVCGANLREPGGLLFDPPVYDPRFEGEVSRKRHLCTACWEEVDAFVDGLR